MAYEFAKVDRKGPLTIVTLNRPEVMNAVQCERYDRGFLRAAER